jgi:tetratricopeptide (TPR) repeat protein
MGDNPPAVEYEIARPALERALELDSNLPEAEAYLGIFNTDFRWDFAEGEKHFLRAIELNPSSDVAYAGTAIVWSITAAPTKLSPR